MKAKRIFGLFLSACLMTSTATQAYASNSSKVQPVKSVVSANSWSGCGGNVAANQDKIIVMLKKEGKIPQNATKEQIQQILSDYLRLDAASKYQPSKREKILDAKIKQRIEENVNLRMTLEKGKMYSKTMQAESWSGSITTVKPLVLLMDFPDYKHTDMLPIESSLNFPDYSPSHYSDMLFGTQGYKLSNGKDAITMRQYYQAQSGGSFEVAGNVSNWYIASKPSIAYGKPWTGGHDIDPAGLVKEALALAAKDMDLSQYDLDGDGIIDHLMIIHAGVGEEEGGGYLGSNAIWSHRGNLGNEYEVTDQLGNKVKAFAYTMIPQNAAAGVVSHEFGHDLGLPDEYDTAYTSNMGEPVGNWSLMASGNWLGEIAGTEPCGLSPYAKQYLQAEFGGNWQNQAVVDLADTTTKGGVQYVLDQASVKGTNYDCIRVNLPQKLTIVATPYSGRKMYFSGTGHDGVRIKNAMTTSVDLTGKTTAKLKFRANYDLEKGYDFASIQVRKAGSEEWTAIPGNITTTSHAQNSAVVVANGITGTSYGMWFGAEFNLNAYVGNTIEIKFAYDTDEYVFGKGFFADDISVEADGNVILSDGAEAESKFALNGFSAIDGRFLNNQYYLLEWRTHQGVDASLATMKFSDMSKYRISYDAGMLVWYVDGYYEANGCDNLVGNHPGEGFLGVVDADQAPFYYMGGGYDYKRMLESTAVQIHDAAFGLRKTSAYVIDDVNEVYKYYDSDSFMNAIFDDSRSYKHWSIPDAGRNIPKLGLKIMVQAENADRSSATIRIFK